ncbi:hypothetical protein MON38_18455 [Hymenobacter sp. DH14]|uniref:Uncharacterized protein n=1 Tax=Hymenobacter cyanobacteriorum TaxID=2926463 RepID=A0A9X1VLU8_9BACT|nr:hypothetical protein [Hymenobacter cyanobacteriorum]MCI1189410.1 hypothetical protein [Hymenobacter cyanobacteriorum]
MINKFLQNRNRVQDLMKSSEFIMPLTHYDSDVEIEERKKTAKLRKVKFENVPVCKKGQDSISWLIDTEVEDCIFSLPPGVKTVDKTIAIFSCTTLYFIMIELKSSLSAIDAGLNEGGINEKIKDTISKISSSIPLHVFKDKYKDVEQLKYICIVCYNKDEVAFKIQESGFDGLDLNAEMFREYEKHIEAIDIENGVLQSPRKGPKTPVSIMDATNHMNKVDVYFIRNPDEQSQSMSVDLTQFLSHIADFEYCQYTEFTLP